jgi:hypothetical protein
MKLTKAGYTLLRVRIEELLIVQMTGDSAWSNFGKHPTKAALNREITRINNEEPKMIFE